MANKDDVKVRVGGDNRPLKSVLRDSRGLISTFARTGSSALAPFTRALGGALRSIFSVQGAIATLAGTGGLGLLVTRSIETADAIGKTASRLGVGVEAFQEITFAAGEAGVQLDLFNTSMAALVRRSGEAIRGNKGFRDAFTDLGISVEELRRTKPEDLLGRVFDEVNKLGTQAEKLAALDRVMSEAGRRLVNFSDLGSEGLAKLRQEARDMGLVLDEVMVRDAEKAGDQLGRVGNIIRTNLTRAVLTLTPQIISMAQGFTKWLVPALQDLQRWLPATYVAADELRARMAGLQAQIEGMAGMSLQDFLALPDKSSLGDAELRQRLAGLLKEYMALGDQLEVRQRQEALLAETLEAVAAPANTTLATKIKEVRDALQFEVDQLGRSAEEQRIWSEAKKAGIEDVEAFRVAIGPLIAEHERLTAAQQANTNVIKAWQAQQAEAKSIFEATRTPLEQYQQKVEKLNSLLQAGAISQETYSRGLDMAQESFDKAAKDTDNLTRSQQRLADVGLSAVDEALTSNMTTLEDWGNFAVRQIGRVLDSYVELLTAEAQGGKSKGGSLFSLLSSAVGLVGGFFGGGSPGAPPGSGPSGVGVAAGSILPPRARGGPVMPGNVYEVNEGTSRELFVPSVSGYVLNAGQTAAALQPGGGGASTINIYEAPISISGSNMNPADLRRLLAEERKKTKQAVAEASRRGGRFAAALG